MSCLISPWTVPLYTCMIVFWSRILCFFVRASVTLFAGEESTHGLVQWFFSQGSGLSEAWSWWEVGRIQLEASSKVFGSKKPAAGLNSLVYAWQTEGCGFIEFDISSSTTPTILRQPLLSPGRLSISQLARPAGGRRRRRVPPAATAGATRLRSSAKTESTFGEHS